MKLPQSRSEASKSGSLLYFTGKPCKHGHPAPRYTSTGQCIECNKMHYHKNTKYNPRPSKEEYLEKARRMAIEKGGKCLSTTYLNAKSYLLFQCSNPNHQPFKSRYDNLKQGKWCRRCKYENQRGKFKYSIDDMRQIAKEHGGKCLSKKFLGVKETLYWLCANLDHPSFPADPDHVINSGQWCPLCGEEKKGRKLRPIEDVLEIVKKRGGIIICFIDEYMGLRTRIKVKCSNGHIWPVTVASLLHAGSWCDKCLEPVGERITRKIFEATYGVSFPKTRPDFLKIKKGSRLELDGYNESLELAFEYQGPYHELPVQIERDKLKRQLCLEYGVNVIEIPYVKNPWPPNNVLKRVAAAIRKIDPERKAILPDEDFYSQEMKELRELADSKGGILLSNTYNGSRGDLWWSCDNPDHPPWPASPSRIRRRGHWCRYCSKSAPLNIDILQAFGKTVNLNLISKNYKGTKAVYKWECKNGHIIERSKSSIVHSIKRDLNACTICSGTYRKITINNLVQTAKDRKGECLSTKYINAHKNILWRCAYGHEFSRPWNKIQQGYWCKQNGCLDNRRF